MVAGAPQRRSYFEVHFSREKTPCAVKSSLRRLAPSPSPVRPSLPIYLTAGRRRCICRRRRSSPGPASTSADRSATPGHAITDTIDVVDTCFWRQFLFNDKPNGVIGGAHAGYNLQFPGWNWFSSSGIVIGLEGTVDGTSLHGTSTSATGVIDEHVDPRMCRVRSAAGSASPGTASSSTAPAAPPSPT